jgi:hypothetical protein
MTCSSGHTDEDGKIVFTIGDNRNYFVNVDTPWGRYPASGSSQVITGSVPDTAYEWSPPDFAGAIPRLDVSGAVSSGTDDDYYLETEAVIQEGLVHGESNVGSIWYTKAHGGDLDYFIVDDTHWGNFTADAPFEAYALALNDDSQDEGFVVPTTDDYYVVWSNKASNDMVHVVNGAVRLYRNTGAVPPVVALMVDKNSASASLLDWEDVIGQNVDGYNLYRSETASDVGGDRTEIELEPYLLAQPSLSEHQDDDIPSVGACYYYSVRTRSTRGGISE